MRSKAYRISWETVSPNYAARMVAEHGEGYWRTVDFDTLKWYSTVVETHNPWAQYALLKECEADHGQPIRNVLLEKRTDEVWKEVQPHE